MPFKPASLEAPLSVTDGSVMFFRGRLGKYIPGSVLDDRRVVAAG